MSGGAKHDNGKPPLTMIPRVAMEAEARVFSFGAKKYSKHNFTKGFDYSRLLDAAMRHITAYAWGEDADIESGESHLAHARCCLAMLMQNIEDNVGLDDRYKGVKK